MREEAEVFSVIRLWLSARTWKKNVPWGAFSHCKQIGNHASLQNKSKYYVHTKKIPARREIIKSLMNVTMRKSNFAFFL